jgi:hypothetical protein
LWGLGRVGHGHHLTRSTRIVPGRAITPANTSRLPRHRLGLRPTAGAALPPLPYPSIARPVPSRCSLGVRGAVDVGTVRCLVDGPSRGSPFYAIQHICGSRSSSSYARWRERRSAPCSPSTWPGRTCTAGTGCGLEDSNMSGATGKRSPFLQVLHRERRRHRQRTDGPDQPQQPCCKRCLEAARRWRRCGPTWTRAVRPPAVLA